jgi:hypothetical protein
LVGKSRHRSARAAGTGKKRRDAQRPTTLPRQQRPHSQPSPAMQVTAAPHAAGRAARLAAPRSALRRSAPRRAALQPRAAFTSEGSNVTLDAYVTVVRGDTQSDCACQGSPAAARLLRLQGKAHCFEKVDSRLVDRFVIEPITPASLESMVAGASRRLAGSLSPASEAVARVSRRAHVVRHHHGREGGRRA